MTKPRPTLIDRLDLPICENCDGEGGWIKDGVWVICQRCKGGGRCDPSQEKSR